jgi:ABC-2 type transport system ATP-binding protein
MLEVQDIEKAFKKKVAVDGVNFYLEKGESVGLLGPNGAGKSTTISMISTLLPPDKGQVIYNGKDAIKNPTELRKELGVVPQEIALYDELSAYENMKFFGKVYGLKGNQLKEKIQEVLKLVGLEDRQKDPVKDYSGGMKRRINIAVALMHDPEILIMDEPTVGIDPQSRNYILDMVRQFNEERGMTVLYTSHYMEEVEKLCDRIYIMDHGKVIASGTKEELKSLVSNEEKVTMSVETIDELFIEKLHSLPFIQQVTTKEHTIEVIVSKGDHILAQLFEAAKDQNMNINGLSIDTPTLEDVFLHLTGRTLRD